MGLAAQDTLLDVAPCLEEWARQLVQRCGPHLGSQGQARVCQRHALQVGGLGAGEAIQRVCSSTAGSVGRSVIL